MKTTACVFDFGGVMTSRTTPDLVRPLVADLGVAWDDVEAGFGRYRRQMDGDFMTLGEMYGRILADVGAAVSADMLARIVEADALSFTVRNERTLEFMRKLKARGYAIGILTNMTSSFVPRFRRVFADFIALADAMVISGEERLYKPMREIYDLLRERIGRPAGELCFFDDVEDNCRGARDAGWRAIRFIDNEQAERDFMSGC